MRRILFICLILVMGCESSGPEFIGGGDTRNFQGVLAADQTVQRHDFVLSNEGTVRFEVLRLAATDPESLLPIESPTILLAIGRLTTGGECGVTFSRVLLEGGSFPVYVDNTAYCLQVFRGSNLPIESTVIYEVALIPAFS